MSDVKQRRQAGRPPGAKNKGVSRKLRILRKKLDDYVDDALRVGQEIMLNGQSKDADRLKAAHKFLDMYIGMGGEIAKHEKLMKELEESGDDDDSSSPTGTMGAVLSMTVVEPN